MKQFDLSLWLKDKSRKVVTRRGNPVRIICTDRKHGEDDLPIVFLEQCHNGEFLLACRKDGRSDAYDTPYDLFFADEELTEFEKELNRIVIAFSDAHAYMDKNEIHHYSKGLLDLASKEIRKEQQDKLGTLEMPIDVTEPYYIKGREDALKDFPKWRKATKCKEFDKHVCVMDYYTFPFLDTEVNEGDYYIKLEDLKTLPKEE